MSLRAIRVKENGMEIVRSATFHDDIEAAGTETTLAWKFTRLNEARMLRIWEQYQTTTTLEMREFAEARKKCFSFCDWALAAGRGYEVESPSAAPLKKRAEGAVLMATIANTHGALAGRADHYMKVERW